MIIRNSDVFIHFAKSKIGNRGNIARKQEKQQRKRQKHLVKHAETPGETVGNS